MPDVKLKNITKIYDEKEFISNLSFHVKSGEYFTICGPTGAGKSSILKIIAGLIKPDKGKIFLGNKIVNNIEAEDRNIGMVFEHHTYALFPHYTVLENVSYGPRVQGENLDEIKSTAMEMLQMVLLDDRANAYPRECSGGMKQRVALARALMSSDQLILLDEPLSALDAKIRMALRYELMHLIRDIGITCIHATQDTEEALMVSDRICVLNKGRIEQIGSPFEIYEHPQNLFVARFMSTCNFIEGKVKSVTDSSSKIQLLNNKIIQITDTSFPENEKIVIAIKAENIEVEGGKVDVFNGIYGVIENSRFVSGNNIDEIKLETGDLFISKKHAIKKWFNSGDQVTIHFKPERAVLFPYPEIGLEKAIEID
ncbi:MAG: ABC transporter ATP-binding protein [Candidatus Helarchaeota archaeon]